MIPLRMYDTKEKTMEKQRLDKIIASTGKWSRKEVKTLIRQCAVLVTYRGPGRPTLEETTLKITRAMDRWLKEHG